MFGRLALGGSIVVHVGVLALVGSHTFALPPRGVAKPPIAEPVVEAVVEVAPIDVALVVDAPTTSAPGAATHASAPVRGARVSTSASGTAVAPEMGHEGTAGMGTGTGMGTEVGTVQLGIPEAVAERIVATSKPLEVVEQSGRMQQHGGEYRVPDLQVPATVHDDGTVTFHDRPAADIHWRIHLPRAQAIGDMLATWYRDPYAQTYARPWQELSKVDQAVEGDAGWDSTGSGEGSPAMSLNEKGYSTAGQPQLPIAGGALDLTSWAMRKAGIDPYASRKRKLLADTFAERAELGARHAERALDRASELAARNLERVWRAPMTAAARREALFELWDDCSEDEGHAGEAGAHARAMVLGSIRAHLPAGSADAYSADEIARLDARRTSRAHFAPYAP